jgi:two-component system nitrogen regulation response regulator NtrX
METILIVDDAPAILATLSGVLMDEGYDVQVAENGAEAIRLVQTHPPAIVILDIWMPEMDGLEVLRTLKCLFPEMIVIMMSGHGSIETAVRAIKLGAYDYLEKPVSLEKIVLMIRHALTEFRLQRENQTLKDQLGRKQVMIGDTPEMVCLLEDIQRAGPSQSRVLITGENGTGKELVARRIHECSSRRVQPFVAINCAALPEGLIESELFGYERGAFTGAQRRKIGQFEWAHGGTLFLDEVADMALSTQAKLLRVLEEQAFQRLGGNELIRTDVRVIAASNKNLPHEVENGRFREDLYYRLNVIPLHLPPLRERRADIPLLVSYFMGEIARDQGIQPKQVAPDAMAALSEYAWPGNIREIRNTMERLTIMTHGPRIAYSDLPPFIAPPQRTPPPTQLKEARRHFEKGWIVERLKECEWNVQQASEAMGLDRTHLYRKMKALGIDPPLQTGEGAP